MVSEQRAKELIEGIEDLPTLPEVVIEITRLVENPDTTAEDVYKIVSTDVSLSATMLKLVNSAFYGMGRSITSLEKAIRILGFTTVRNIALAAFVFDAFLTGKGHVDYKAFWLHSIGTATAAGVIAKKKAAVDVSEYFVYGLLHDLGVVVYMQYLPEEYRQVRQLAAQGVPIEEAERQVVGCTHGEIGAALAERWDFPPVLVAVIRHHNTPTAPETFAGEVAVTICADAISRALGVGESISVKMLPIPEETWKLAGVKEGQMGKILDEVGLEMENSRSFINLLYR